MPMILENGVELEIWDKEIRRLKKRDLIYFCKDCRCWHANETLYAVKNTGADKGLYWSNQEGWTELEQASFYSFEETGKYIPAQPGEYEQVM